MVTNSAKIELSDGKPDDNNRASGERKVRMTDIMTDKQFDKILKMVSMILDGCKDLEEAKKKVAELLEDQKKEKAE